MSDSWSIGIDKVKEVSHYRSGKKYRRYGMMEKIDTIFLNRFFTVPYIDRMAATGNVPDGFLTCFRRYVDNGLLTCGEAISEVYQFMDREYRNEYYFKNTILNQLLLEKHDIRNSSALTELPIAESKADIVIINGRGTVYEIKTDLDNLNRLDTQIDDYYKAFSYVNVVVGKKQLERVKDLLADTKVGVYELTQTGNLLQRKKANCNQAGLSYEALFRLLRKPEFESILMKHFGRLPETNDFQYYRECVKWFRDINIKTLQKEVMACLKSRTYVIKENVSSVPYELRFYAYFSKRFNNSINDFNDLLQKVVREA